MAIHLITGYAGQEHITSADQGAYNMATFGEGEFVYDRGDKFEASVISSNQISISDGEALMQGRFIKIPIGTTESVEIDNGTIGMKRNDLICLKYEKDSTTGIESVSLVVKKGTEAETSPTDPTYTHGSITDGNDLVNEMPLYRIYLDGLTVQTVTQLFRVVKPAAETINPQWELLTDRTIANNSATAVETICRGMTPAEVKSKYNAFIIITTFKYRPVKYDSQFSENLRSEQFVNIVPTCDLPSEIIGGGIIKPYYIFGIGGMDTRNKFYGFKESYGDDRKHEIMPTYYSSLSFGSVNTQEYPSYGLYSIQGDVVRTFSDDDISFGQLKDVERRYRIYGVTRVS